jgi:hypothetical protein
MIINRLFRFIQRAVLVVSALLFTSSGITGQVTEFSYTGSWGEQGFTLISNTPSKVVINFSITDFSIEDRVINGEGMKTVLLPGAFLQNNAGAPNLPGRGKFIAVPQGASAVITDIKSRSERIAGINISPAPRIPFVTDPPPLQFEKDPSIYGRNEFYPAEPVVLSAPRKVRGMDAVIVGVTPFQYNPVTKELVVIRDIQVEISFEGGHGHFGEDRYRSPWWDEILRDMMCNSASFGEPENPAPSVSPLDQAWDYVIITPDNPVFIEWADSLCRWRNEQGIPTGVVTLSEIGGNNPTSIENYIDSAYYNWPSPPSAFLLLGDYGTSGDNCIVSPVWDGYCVSDNIYADVDGDDLPDVVPARITAQNGDQLSAMIGKMMDYELSPPTDPDFYSHPVSSGGWQNDRWFILCAEILWGYWKYGLEKEPVREYAGFSGGAPSYWSTNPNTGMVVSYFGPFGLGYIPQVPSHLTDWGGNAARINSDLNSGAFMLVHRDHAVEAGWDTPVYQIPDLSGLTQNPLSFVFSLSCLTGKFNLSGDCFAEAFHRPQYRALGVIGASEISYSFVNDVYAWGLWDQMWPGFDPGYGEPESVGHFIRPAFANASAKYYLEASNWPYNPQNKPHTYYLFHHHGDAFLNVYSEVPQTLFVSYDTVVDPGSSQFAITATAGALIGLSVGGNYLASAIATGYSQEIPITPQSHGTLIKVVVTWQNYYRYSGVAEVAGPPTQAIEPDPPDSATGTRPFTGLHWCAGPLGITGYYKVYLGTDSPPTSIANGIVVTDTFYFPEEDLEFEMHYFWRIDSYNQYGERSGSLWDFTTGPPPDEDFETGDFSLFEWYFEGAADWLINTETARHGAFSAKSGAIGPGETSSLLIGNFSESFSFVPLSFWVKTSTAEGTNKLQFLIDGAVTDEWSGETEWTEGLYSFMPGFHVFEWKYVKTAEEGNDEDGVWIDYIEFPPASIPIMVDAGKDTSVCEGSNIQLDGYALNYFSLEWTTSGDGSFDNDTILVPVYTPGPGDLAAQSVQLILTAYRYSNSNSDDLTLSFSPLPLAPNPPEGPAFVDIFYTPSTSYSTSGGTYAMDYLWVLQPQEAGSLVSEDLSCIVTWNPIFLGVAILFVKGVNGCGEGPCSDVLEILVSNTVGLPGQKTEEPAVRIIPNPTGGQFRAEIETKQALKLNLQLLNEKGGLLFEEKNVLAEGTISRVLMLHNCNSGIHFFQITGDGIFLTKKILCLP